MNRQERLKLAIDYIEDNLAGEISIDNAAKIACYSKYHFHRVFYSCFNITFADYVRKRKCTLAAADLIRGKEKVMDIALKYGYESPNAFTRIFRQTHGVNPGKVRSSQAKLATYNRIYVPAEIAGMEKIDYKIVERPSFNVVGKSKRFEFNEFTKNGSKFWKDYVRSAEYKALGQLTKGKPGQVTGAPLLSVYFPEEKSKRDEFLDVLGVESITGMDATSYETHRVPSAIYAEFECTYKTSMKTNRYIYGDWFSATGYERDGTKPDIVAYFPIPYRPFSEMGVRWWIPVV